MLRFITQIACLMFTTIVCVCAQAQVSEPSQAEKYGVHEITITYDDSGISNVWMNVPFSATFTTPSGASKTIDGFYYNTDTWKFRFAPSEVGNYTWTGNIYGNPISGSFTSVDAGNKGFIRLHPNNYNRWIYEGDGSLFDAAGFQTWMTNPTEHGKDIIGARDLHAGAFPMEEIAGRAGLEEWLVANADETGYNLYRHGFGQSYHVWETVTHSTLKLEEDPLIFTDKIFEAMRARDIRIMLCITGWDPYLFRFSNPTEQAVTNSFARYIVARYGAMIDMWQLANESYPTNEWIAYFADQVNQYDIYDHKISMSWAYPNHPDIEISSPHWYTQPLHEGAVDGAMMAWIYNGQGQPAKDEGGMPLVATEFGVGGECYYPMHAYANSAQYWVAFFNEVVLINWDQSQHKHQTLGVYLDPELRSYNRAMTNFTAKVEADVVMDSSISVTHNYYAQARAYGLRSANDIYVYLVNPAGHANGPAATLHFNAPQAGAAMWYDPQSGDVISTFNVNAGQQSIQCPIFPRDLAFMVDGGAAFIETPATAKAGADIVAIDSDNDGFATVTLSDAGSFDTDGGSIVDYSWSQYGKILGTGPSITATFPGGVNYATLRVVDDEGNVSTDYVKITVNSTQGSTPPWLSAGGFGSTPDNDGDGLVTIGARVISRDADGDFRDNSYVFTNAHTGQVIPTDVSFRHQAWTEGRNMTLPLGGHLITVTATDPDGNTGSSTYFTVTYDPNTQHPHADAGQNMQVTDTDGDGY
ncbi:MAG: DUF5060 domain-containing protein, partial [Planctomycetes bacterium]|nr:DUF5060 domain-containing protein [Planctomycetota bacterium]